MNRKIALVVSIFIGILLSSQLSAQFKIKGIVTDTSDLKSTALTNISIMSSGDSILQNFTHADANGSFELNVKQAGNYFVRFSHPSFTSYVLDVKVEKPVTDLDTVIMITYTKLLAEFVVRDSRPITIKGDTVEYIADSFKVRDFATVDELLKKLPGIEIDRSGKITAQGKKVSKMLVDGEEFFSDDPAVVAKMLRAGDIDRVQVFDNKSEEAKLTGIPDADESKAINLSLKESAKNGYFGKLEGAVGPPKYYEGQAMINAYKGKRKMAAYLIGSNTNNQGLGWDDRRNFGSGGGVSFVSDDGGSVTTTYSSDDNSGVDYGGNYSGQGVPQSLNGGASYSNKYGKDGRFGLSINYTGRDGKRTIETENRSQYFTQDTQYVNSSNNFTQNRQLTQKLNANLDLKIDSLSSIRLNMSFGAKKDQNENSSYSDYANINNVKINQSQSGNNSQSDGLNGKFDLNYSKRFMKKGRSLYLSANGNGNKKAGTTDFESSNQFFQSNSNLQYNQLKNDSSSNINAAARVSYTEPLLEDKVFLTINGGTNSIKNESQLSTYDRDPLNFTDTFNGRFSSNGTNTTNTNIVGATLRYSGKVIRFNVGGDMNFSKYKNINNFDGYVFQREYNNLLPRASINYSKKRSSSIGLRYDGGANQPSIDQVLVLVQNTDPLNVYLGNPNLVQSYTNRFSLNFNQYKMLSQQYLYGNLSFASIKNDFGEQRTISSDGVNTTQTINVDGNWNAGAWLGFGYKIKPLKLNGRISLNTDLNNRNSFFNGLKNNSLNWNQNIGFEFEYSNDTGLNFRVNLEPSYNMNRTSVSLAAKNNFFSSRQNIDVSYRWPFGMETGISTDWFLREKQTENDKNNNVFLANAYVEKTLLKDRSLLLRLSGNDIFNQNVGFSRFNNGNVISETTYNTIQRYFMLKLTWNFKKSTGEKKESTNTMNFGF